MEKKTIIHLDTVNYIKITKTNITFTFSWHSIVIKNENIDDELLLMWNEEFVDAFRELIK